MHFKLTMSDRRVLHFRCLRALHFRFTMPARGSVHKRNLFSASVQARRRNMLSRQRVLLFILQFNIRALRSAAACAVQAEHPKLQRKLGVLFRHLPQRCLLLPTARQHML